jgi:hypothetical protein
MSTTTMKQPIAQPAATAQVAPFAARRSAWMGAWMGAWLALGYGAVFALYAMMRATFAIVALGPERPAGTIPAVAVALLYTSLVFALLAVPGAALLGAGTAALIRRLLPRLNRRGSPARAALIGALTAFTLWLIFYTLQTLALGDRLTWAYPATFLFWIGLPGVVYVAAAAWGARRLTATSIQ